jgi:hypothetical protein
MSSAAHAVEGGIGAYFLGTRDTLSGIVPPAGTYLSLTYDHLSGDVDGITVGGLPIRANVNVDLNLYRLGLTHVLDGEIAGGTPGFNVTIPIPDVALDYTAVTPPVVGVGFDDATSGVGDIAVTGLLGWHSGNLHTSTALSIYMPTGDYSTASLDIPNRTIDALSNGKNIWSFQPVFAATWLDPKTGFEASGAASLLFSTKNTATNYQTAPAFQFEGAVVQRLPSGWGIGLAGYTYQQLADDSGSGADQSRAFLGAESLKARVR